LIALLLFLLLVAVLFGLGAAVHLLWIIAVIALILWVVGFLFRPRGGALVLLVDRRRDGMRIGWGLAPGLFLIRVGLVSPRRVRRS